MIISLLFGLLLGAATIIFALQNMTTITVMFFNWQFEGSLALILMLAVAAGILMSFLLALPDIIKKHFQVSALRKDNEKLYSEIRDKKIEVEAEKNKLAATNAYLDSVEEKEII